MTTAPKAARIAGIWAAIPTPFTPDGALDEAGVRRNVRHFADGLGLDGVFCNGLMGEIWALELDERRRLAEIIRDEAGDRLKVSVVTSHHAHGETVALTRHAAAIGCDAAVLLAPAVDPRDDETIFRHLGRRGGAGSGHLDQGRFKSFAVQADEHLLAVWRSIERHPLRANLVRRAEDWRRSSPWRRRFGGATARGLLSDGPLPLPADWTAWVNGAETAVELEALRRCVARGRPFGAEAWVADGVRRLGLEITARPRGRPRRPQKGS